MMKTAAISDIIRKIEYNKWEMSGMVLKKGKRAVEYDGNLFYWFVRASDAGILRIHILSEDKSINLEYSLFNSEVAVTPVYIKHLLNSYFEQ